ncbi:hypothetical protein ASPZODRAFT_1811548 [Penicilliopsis zonata CBS 506.65]|uniref:Uncharacterized protein n=1 Tax=Penicilliopsis zonata CBS 506.65 TaxID=1073090 RepID=A0A1L9SL82_9EURO|nr:hypothetical protein ASPZODRAFT_1811548 [Penicilliopsis zonata CBS 506.65]OJJ47938.1 hypothetical protein ASPZODRAFT_1811548 [Penicilliopsis zonata CBS 506.65]
MSTLTRAFTKRSKRPEVSAPMPYREGQIKFSSGTIKRGKISGPVQLLSTTNMLVYNAPDLQPMSASSSSSLQSSHDGSEDSASPSSLVSPATTPDTWSNEASPVSPNHLSGYFPKRSATITSHPRSSSSSTDSAPLVPKRALSHTKRSHQELARQRSISRTSPPALNSLRSSPSMRMPPNDAASAAAIQPHPFGKELEQVNEVAEEFGGGRHVLDEEERILQHKGLMKFTANDYLVEIQDLYSSIFDDQLGPISTPWV